MISFSVCSDNPLALYNVATHYFAGQGVAQDLKKASEYYEKASVLGFSPAQVHVLIQLHFRSIFIFFPQVNLGNMYYTGMGVVKNRDKAKELFKLAADSDENAKGLLELIKAEEKKEVEQDGGDTK